MNITRRFFKPLKTIWYKFNSQTMSTQVESILSPKGSFIFRQLFEETSSTYSYLIGDAVSRNAVLIDPVLETVERDLELVKELDLNLCFVVNTHVHADHVTGSGKIKQKLTNNCRSVISASANAVGDILLEDGELLKCGNIELECRHTPGHTNGCATFVMKQTESAFTGDTLLIRGCGRTDFQDGSSEKLYKSVHSKIFSLPDHYFIFPAHDYTGRMLSTVGEEKKYNLRLTKSLTEFMEIMNNLNLPKPLQIDKAVPLNLTCGIQT